MFSNGHIFLFSSIGGSRILPKADWLQVLYSGHPLTPKEIHIGFIRPYITHILFYSLTHNRFCSTIFLRFLLLHCLPAFFYKVLKMPTVVPDLFWQQSTRFRSDRILTGAFLWMSIRPLIPFRHWNNTLAPNPQNKPACQHFKTSYVFYFC